MNQVTRNNNYAVRAVEAGDTDQVLFSPYNPATNKVVFAPYGDAVVWADILSKVIAKVTQANTL